MEPIFFGANLFIFFIFSYLWYLTLLVSIRGSCYPHIECSHTSSHPTKISATLPFVGWIKVKAHTVECLLKFINFGHAKTAIKWGCLELLRFLITVGAVSLLKLHYQLDRNSARVKLLDPINLGLKLCLNCSVCWA